MGGEPKALTHPPQKYEDDETITADLAGECGRECDQNEDLREVKEIAVAKMTNFQQIDVECAVTALSIGVKEITGENLNDAATQAFLKDYCAELKSKVLDEAKPVSLRAQGFLHFAELSIDPPGCNPAAARRIRAKSAAPVPASSASEGKTGDENELCAQGEGKGNKEIECRVHLHNGYSSDNEAIMARAAKKERN